MECPQTETLNQPGLFERLKASGKRIPLSGSLEVTFRCNLHCVHCYLGDNRSGVPGKKELTKEEIFGILDQVSDAGTLWFLLTGGEPFLRPDFMDIYRYAAHKGLIVTIFTNGTMLTPRIVDELAELPPFLMEITLYGATEETYERITGVKGSYTRCIRGIDSLMKVNVPVKLKTILMRQNIHEFDAIKGFASSLGVGYRYDAFIMGAMNNSQEPIKFRLTPEEAVALERKNEKLLIELRALLDQRIGKPVRDAMYKCGAALNTFHIDPYGRLNPCILSREQNYDLLAGSFSEGWGVFLEQVRSQPSRANERCKDCNLLALCTQCPGKASLENLAMDEPIDYLCQVGHLRAASIGEIISGNLGG